MDSRVYSLGIPEQVLGALSGKVVAVGMIAALLWAARGRGYGG